MSGILIKNGFIVVMDAHKTIYKKGFLRIADDQIVEVGPGESIELPGEKVIDAKNMVVLPGFVNVHCHLQQYFRGFYEYNDDFFTVSLAMEKYRDPKDMDDLGMASCAEFIYTGCTTIQNMYTYQDGFAQAVESAGNRAVLGSDIEEVDIEVLKTGIYKYLPEKGKKAYERAVDLHKNWHEKAHGRIRVVMAPKAPDLATPDTYIKCKSYARENGLRMTTHLSQNWREVTQVRKIYNLTPPQLLNKIGVLDDYLSSAHCSFITREDLDIIIASGMAIMHCRAYNNPFVHWIDKGIPLGLGTDDYNHDMFTLFRQNLLGQRVRARLVGGSDDADSIRSYPARPTFYELLELSTIGGAKVLGLDNEIGSLEKGKKADVILFDMNNPLLRPNNEPIATMVLYGSSSDIDTVIVDGRILKEGKKLVTIDQKKVLNMAQNKIEEIIDRFKFEHPEQFNIWKSKSPQVCE